MDFLIQSGRQWIAQWHEASPASRWTLGFVIALGCGAIVLAIGWPRQEPREFLFDGVEFSRSELTAMEAAFGKSQLNDARIVGRSIEVPQRGKHLYLKALFDQQALPATFFTYAQRSLASDHPFSSPRQREAVAKLAKEQEVALMLRKIAGIEEASVQYEDTDLGGFPRRRQRQATAAVRAQSDRVLEPTVVNAIRVTMMNTLGIADPHSVTVLDLNAGIAHSGPDLTPSPPAAQTVRVAGTTEALPIGFANGDAAPPRGVEAEPSPKEEPHRHHRRVGAPGPRPRSHGLRSRLDDASHRQRGQCQSPLAANHDLAEGQQPDAVREHRRILVPGPSGERSETHAHREPSGPVADPQRRRATRFRGAAQSCRGKSTSDVAALREKTAAGADPPGCAQPPRRHSDNG